LKHVTHASAARSQSEKRTFLALSLDQSGVSLIRETDNETALDKNATARSSLRRGI